MCFFNFRGYQIHSYIFYIDTDALIHTLIVNVFIRAFCRSENRGKAPKSKQIDNVLLFRSEQIIFEQKRAVHMLATISHPGTLEC